MSPARALALQLLAAAAAALGACRYAATEVVVVVGSDAPADRALTVVARVRDERGEVAGPTWVAGPGGAVRLPASFGVTPRAGAARDGQVTVVLEARLEASADDPARHFRRTARFSFVPHATTRLPLFLAIACANRAEGCQGASGDACTVSVSCEERGQTCGDDGRCTSVVTTPTPIDPRADAGVNVFDVPAPPPPDAPASDAAADAPADAGPPVPPTLRFAASDAHTCVIRAGRVYCWGRNDRGEIGAGAMGGTAPTPQAVTGLPPGTPTHVCTGGVDRFSCAVVAGEAYCWGSNAYGQLGNGSQTSSAVPVRVAGLTGVTHVSCGVEFACAAAGGRAYCWGHGWLGQLGTGTTDNAFTPVPVAMPAGRRATFVWAGYDHACALDEAQGAWCWGRNENDRALGLGPSPPPALAPVAVAGGHRFAHLEIAAWGACGLTPAGGALCWGDNTGTGAASDVPVAPAGLAPGLRAVARGGGTSVNDASCVVTAAGALACWGAGQFGRLGTGDEMSRGAPTPVVGLADPVTDVAVGFDHTCAITTRDEVFCWGLGTSGQLGDGRAVTSAMPVRVVFP